MGISIMWVIELGVVRVIYYSYRSVGNGYYNHIDVIDDYNDYVMLRNH